MPSCLLIAAEFVALCCAIADQHNSDTVANAALMAAIKFSTVLGKLRRIIAPAQFSGYIKFARLF